MKAKIGFARTRQRTPVGKCDLQHGKRADDVGLNEWRRLIDQARRGFLQMRDPDRRAFLENASQRGRVNNVDPFELETFAPLPPSRDS